jgi:hypothetical protein
MLEPESGQLLVNLGAKKATYLVRFPFLSSNVLCETGVVFSPLFPRLD